VTADRSSSRSISKAPSSGVSSSQDTHSAVTRAADALTRFGLPAIILSLPLEFTVDLFRLQLVRIVLLVVAVAFAYLVIIGRRELILPRRVSIALLLVYVAASVISWLLTRAPGSANSLLAVVAYPVMALIVVNLSRSDQDHLASWIAFLVSGLLVALVGAFLYYTHLWIWRPDPSVLGRVNATFADPNITARFLTLATCAAVLMFAARRGPSWLAVATAAACGAVLPLTFSRSGLLIFVVSVVLACFFGSYRRRAAAIAAVALVVFGLSISINPDTRQRATLAAQSITNTVENVFFHQHVGVAKPPLGGVALDQDRTYLIAAGWQMFVDHPALGVGFGGYEHSLLTTYQRFLPAHYSDSESHTSIVTIISEQGVIGLAIFAGFLFLLAMELVRSMRRRSPWRNWIIMPGVLVVPILMYSQFEGRLITEPYLWLALGLLYSAQWLDGHQSQATQTDSETAA
jgi:O-antigen ligase